jgi:hypothetical protein
MMPTNYKFRVVLHIFKAKLTHVTSEAIYTHNHQKCSCINSNITISVSSGFSLNQVSYGCCLFLYNLKYLNVQLYNLGTQCKRIFISCDIESKCTVGKFQKISCLHCKMTFFPKTVFCALSRLSFKMVHM